MIRSPHRKKLSIRDARKPIRVGNPAAMGNQAGANRKQSVGQQPDGFAREDSRN